MIIIFVIVQNEWDEDVCVWVCEGSVPHSGAEGGGNAPISWML